jgi:hypothetical protein
LGNFWTVGFLGNFWTARFLRNLWTAARVSYGLLFEYEMLF